MLQRLSDAGSVGLSGEFLKFRGLSGRELREAGAGRRMPLSKVRAIAALILLTTLPNLSTGCASHAKRYEGASAKPSRTLALQPGDTLDVKFVYWPELDEQQAVRPDGKISLPMVGEVEAEGLTPDEFHARLMDLYKDKITDPEINIVVRSMDSRRVYVGGEVKAPGMLPIEGRLTALQAIMQAGGFVKESAKMSNVVVVRQQDGKQVATAVDLAKALKGNETDPFYLEPYDIVYVPRTAIDKLDQWVEAYINKLVPRSVHYTFNDIVGGASTTKNQSVQFQFTPVR